MAALHGAVALIQVHGVALVVGQDLDLNVARVLHKLLHKHRAVAERRPRFGARALKRVLYLRLCV